MHLNDCAELYNYGRKASGLFKINPPSDGDDTKWYRTFCEDGWTEIARRTQNFDDAVSKNTTQVFRSGNFSQKGSHNLIVINVRCRV